MPKLPVARIQDYRNFGFMMGSVLALLGSWPFLFSDGPARIWALLLSIVLVCLGALLPYALRPLYQGWMRIGAVLGWINTRILLALCFYVLVFPLGLVMRLLGKDPLHKYLDSNLQTYRQPREGMPRTQMEKQY